MIVILAAAATREYVKFVTVSEYFASHTPRQEIELNEVSNWIDHFRWWSGDIVDMDQNSMAEGIRRVIGACDRRRTR